MSRPSTSIRSTSWQAKARAAGVLLSIPLALLYDLMIAAVAMLWLVRAASRDGLLPWEKLPLAFCYLVPLACRYVGEGLGIPLTPLGPIALLGLTIVGSLSTLKPRPDAQAGTALDRAPALG
jgi:hypothetical protein